MVQFRGSRTAEAVSFRRRRRGLARERRPDDAAVLVELHAEAQAHLVQDVLDLVERLAAEILGLEHFGFGLLHELAQVLDVGVLQAIVGAHGKLELFDGAVEIFEARIGVILDHFFGKLGLLLEVDEDAHVVLDQLRGKTDGILRSDRGVGPDFEGELFVVGHLAETRGFDRVVDLAHRRVDRVDRDVADRQILVEVAVGGHVAAAVLHAQFEFELAAFADRGDVNVLVEHGDVGVFFDLRGGHRTRHIDVQRDGLRLVGVQLQRNLLEVEDDVGGVFDHAGNRRKFVQHAFDFHGGDRRAFDRAQQRAPQRVPDGGSPAALKRLRGKFPELVGECLGFCRQPLWFLKALPHLCPSFRPAHGGPANNFEKIRIRNYFEYSSTMSCSFIGGVCTSSRRGMSHHARLEIFAVDIEPRRHALALRQISRFEHHGVLVHLVLQRDFVADLHQVAGDVHLLALHADVAVQHELARLRARAGKTRCGRPRCRDGARA